MDSLIYENFDLLIEQFDQEYRARIIYSPSGEASTTFVLPFNESQLQLIPLLYQQSFQQLTDVSGIPDEAEELDIKTFGERLFNVVFADQVGECFTRSLDLVRQQNKRLRIRLRFGADASALAAFPWEYLYSSKLNRYLAISDQTVLVRYLELAHPQSALHVQPPLTILVITSNPTDLPALEVNKEFQQLEKAVQKLQDNKSILLIRLETATLTNLQDLLRQHTVHILHFIGHGYYEPDSGEGGLAFESADGQADIVSIDRLISLLGDEQTLRLIILNACEGARGDRDELFAGIAQSLVKQQVPAVLAMQYPVSDQAAMTLSQEFYEAVADGYPVDVALTEARKAIFAQDNSWEWGTPVLYMRTPDGILFAPDESLTQRESIDDWHWRGAIWLAGGLLGTVLLFGLGYLFVQNNPTLLRVLMAMTAMITFLVGFFSLQGDKSILPRLSQWVGNSYPAQIGMGAIITCSLVAWGVWGWPTILQANCDPILGCKEPNEQWFAVGEWQLLVDEPTQFEKVLTSKMRDVLYQKLSLVDGLQRVSTDSSQMSDAVRQNLDILIEGDYQRLGIPQLSAYLRDLRGELNEVVVVEGDPDVIQSRADTCLLEMQHQLAIDILETLKIEVPPSVHASMRTIPTVSCEALMLNFEAAQEFASGGSIALAKSKFEQALTLDPNYGDASNNLGRVLEFEGDFEGAIAAYEKAISIQAKIPLYYYNLGNGYQKLAHNDVVLDLEPFMASLDPAAQESLRSAEEAYLMALNYDPVYTKTLNNLGYTYLLMDELTLAQETLERGIALDPDAADLHKNLGLLYLAQNKSAEAIDTLNKAVTLFPTYAEALYFLSLAQWADEQKESACTTLLFGYAPLANLDNPDREAKAETLFMEWKCGQS